MQVQQSQPINARKEYHERMPVLLPPERYAAWLGTDTPVDDLKRMLIPHPVDEMVAVPVAPLVNKATNEGPECLTPAV